ncbi:nascent polypeptide-associated complex subunit alpha-like protein 4 [Silene latifolia]|uniref:nascent polypeptide-associated complex subunit alpha-like protein 4 n=1 Tax=Silene latifolia TaxID=37657 RepID=UPI003D783AD9
MVDLGSGNDVQQQSTSMEEIRMDMLRRGVKPVKDVNRIIIERAENELSFISKPEVFKSPDSESYVIFGEVKIEEPRSEPESSSATANIPNEKKAEVNETVIFDPDDIEMVMAQTRVSRRKALKALEANNGDPFNAIMNLIYLAKKVEDVDIGEPDEFDPDEIETVMKRGGVSRRTAVKALVANDGDCFNALMNILLLTKKEVDDRDVEKVMALASVSRIKASMAIKACNGDVNSAILNLTC